jgi:hypothetical protein
LVGDGLAATSNIKVDYHADGFELDTVNFKHDNESAYMHRIDERVVAEAAKGIKATRPIFPGCIWNIPMIWATAMAIARSIIVPYEMMDASRWVSYGKPYNIARKI